MTAESTPRASRSRRLRLALLIPVVFHRLGFANQLAKRSILVLHTVGRKSGQHRIAGLSFALDGRTAYVAAGWGTRTGWYQNLLANPNASVQIGRQTIAVQARPVANEEEQARAAALLSAVDGGPPRLVQPFFRLLGFDYAAERTQAFAEPQRLTLMGLELGEPLATPRLPEARARRLPLVVGGLVLGALVFAIRRRRRRPK